MGGSYEACAESISDQHRLCRLRQCPDPRPRSCAEQPRQGLMGVVRAHQQIGAEHKQQCAVRDLGVERRYVPAKSKISRLLGAAKLRTDPGSRALRAASPATRGHTGRNPQNPECAGVDRAGAASVRIAAARRSGRPGEEVSEEVRRNRATFDFIVCNKLHTKAGLRVAFAAGQPISFPLESMEAKANWVPVGNRSASDYHINTASDNKRYALVSMHIISKQVPNWTWATFEHKDNPGRCDIIGCHDNFGAVVQDVAPHDAPGGKYDPCVKTPALKKLLADAGLPPLWENYCLKGSQVDFVTATGVPTRLGNS